MGRLKLALALSLIGSAAGAAGPQLALQPVATGLDQPLGIVNAGDGRLFFVLQRGRIVIYDGSRVLPDPFLDVSGLVSCCEERGLLGLAFHPHYADNGFFFIDYTATNGDVTVARYHVSGDPNRADPGSATIVLTIQHRTFPNHNGGQLQFGPDGFLYIGVGDGGSAGDPNNNGQNTSVLLGKILRIDVDSLPYRIPDGNPFRNEIWAYGLRNPWRFSFDSSNNLWIGDVGQDRYEEVDLQPARSPGGENYGWRLMEGFHCFDPPANCQNPSLTLPILEYTHDNNNCSITGGYRYRGSRYPRLRDLYFYGDYCSGSIWAAAQQSDGSWRAQPMLSTTMRISSFGEDVSGELYVADLQGTISRLIDTAPPSPRRRAVGK